MPVGPVPFALSVHHFINSVGADAGFASIIGLAIVILLWFAQARETASLREHAAEAAQRIQQLEARIVHLTRGQPAAAPRPQAPAVTPAPAGARVEAGVGASVGAGAVAAGIASASARPALSPVPPGAPAGVGAPALTAATRLIPADAPAAEPEQEPVPVGVPAEAEVPAAAPVPASAPSESWSPSNTDSFVTPPPATAAAGANGAAHERGTAAAVSDPPPRVQLRSSTPPPRRPVPPPPPPRGPAPQRSGASRGLIAVLGVLLIGAVVAVLLIATSSGGTPKNASKTQTSNAPAAGHKSKHKSAPAFSPATVTVSVLNGTSITNLAHRVGQTLATMGYKEGTIATAADQTHTTTVVEYEPGHRSNAVHVATSLKLTGSSVQPIDPTTQQVACPPPGTCTATVVVTVGTDLGNTT